MKVKDPSGWGLSISLKNIQWAGLEELLFVKEMLYQIVHMKKPCGHYYNYT
jgi:hypothetical protein